MICYDEKGVHYGKPNYYANFNVLLKLISNVVTSKRKREENSDSDDDTEDALRKLKAKITKLKSHNKKLTLRTRKLSSKKNYNGTNVSGNS